MAQLAGRARDRSRCGDRRGRRTGDHHSGSRLRQHPLRGAHRRPGRWRVPPGPAAEGGLQVRRRARRDRRALRRRAARIPAGRVLRRGGDQQHRPGRRLLRRRLRAPGRAGACPGRGDRLLVRGHLADRDRDRADHRPAGRARGRTHPRRGATGHERLRLRCHRRPDERRGHDRHHGRRHGRRRRCRRAGSSAGVGGAGRECVGRPRAHRLPAGRRGPAGAEHRRPGVHAGEPATGRPGRAPGAAGDPVGPPRGPGGEGPESSPSPTSCAPAPGARSTWSSRWSPTR